MQFRLVYQGRLPAVGRNDTRARDKHRIRKDIHQQLVELWNTHPFIREYAARGRYSVPVFRDGKYVLEAGGEFPSTVEHLAKKFERCGYRFFPLVGTAFGTGTETACGIDILFLRRDEPGNLVKSGGDIDNRIKVLFDALRMPQTCDELAGCTPAADEDPFFCLMEDDSLIREVKITTDRLLTPKADNENIHDVHLIIHVTTLTIGRVFSDLGFGHEYEADET